MKCDIIIPVWNQLDATKECIDSLFKHADYPARLIVIDNGSENETEHYLKSIKGTDMLDYLLIRNEKNLGFVKAINQGIVVSDNQYLCIMNNDTIATDRWLSEMVRVMDTYPEIGLLNPSSNTSGEFPDKGESIDDYADRIYKSDAGKVQELYTCRGFCMLLRRSVIQKVGLLDEIPSRILR